MPALDGLRGVASLVVVLHHLYLIAVPALVAQGGTTVGSAYWWISETPLKLMSAGTEAVTVFFILSGLVVALPALGNAGYSWRSFYLSRAVRLYLPVWGALIIAACAVWFIPRSTAAITNGSWLATTNARSVPFGYLLSQASLTRVGYGIDNALWSLRWELAFSALLPIYVLIARRLGRMTVPMVVACVVASMFGSLIHIDALKYLPVFFVGTVVAARLKDLRAYATRHAADRHAAALGIAFVAVSGTLLLTGWLTRSVVSPSAPVGVLLEQLSVLGGLGIVTAAIVVTGARRFLEHTVAQWLGKVSFSLYLVHVPLLVTLAYALGDGSWWLVGLVGVPCSLLLAWAFYLGVERPAQSFARRVGRMAARSGFVPAKRYPQLNEHTAAESRMGLARFGR